MLHQNEWCNTGYWSPETHKGNVCNVMILFLRGRTENMHKENLIHRAMNAVPWVIMTVSKYRVPVHWAVHRILNPRILLQAQEDCCIFDWHIPATSDVTPDVAGMSVKNAAVFLCLQQNLRVRNSVYRPVWLWLTLFGMALRMCDIIKHEKCLFLHVMLCFSSSLMDLH